MLGQYTMLDGVFILWRVINGPGSAELHHSEEQASQRNDMSTSQIEQSGEGVNDRGPENTKTQQIPESLHSASMAASGT